VDAVQSVIDDVHADRLIAGSRGRRKVRELLLGSTARAFMSAIRIPMMFAGPDCQAPSNYSIRKILCLLSLQGDYAELAHFAFYLAEVHDARIVLLHVLEAAREQDINPARTEEWTRTVLRGLIDSYGRRKDYASVLVSRGNVATEALSALEDSGADLVITGTREPEHRSPLRDGIAYQLVASAKVPVICYRVNRGGLREPASAAHEKATMHS
jgi:nucleotide-binding universal stress UspA family protein